MTHRSNITVLVFLLLGLWLQLEVARGESSDLIATAYEVRIAGLPALRIKYSVRISSASYRSEVSIKTKGMTAVALCDSSLDILEREWISQIAKLLAQELGIEVRDHEIDAVINWATGRLRDRRAIIDCIVRLAIKRPEVLAVMGELCELVAEVDSKANISEEETVHFIRDLIATKWNAH